MGIIAKSNGGDFELTPMGSYVARCYKMIDIGTQPGFSDADRAQRKVWIYWELLEDEDGEPVRMKDGKPFSISQKYTLSISPKANLRKDLDAWRGIAFTETEAEAFDITKLLGTYCRLQVVHNESGGRMYANLGGVGFTKKKPEGENDTSWWSVEEPDMQVFEKFPDWLKEKIEIAPEFREHYKIDKPTEVHDEAINLDDLPKEFQN